MLVHSAPVEAQNLFDDAAIPTSPATPTAKLAVEPLIELEFENIQVVDLLKVIAKSFGINVLINEDVTGTLHYVNIKGKSPDEALQYVARNARLKLRRENDGTYQIGKTLEEDFPASAPAIAPSNNGFGGLNSGTGNAALEPLGSPAITSQNSFGRPNNLASSLDLPELVAAGSSKRASAKKGGATPVRLRNVKPSIMAYWLDPANNPVPIDFMVSQDSSSKYGTQAPARLALNPADQAALGGGNSMGTFGAGAPSPYVNPYIQRSSSSRIAPEVRSNFQFGGFNNNNRNQVGGGNQGGGAGGGGSFQLPGEIEEIIAIDAQNTLLVAGGTDEDIDRLREIIAILDRPLRQVEIEAQFVRVSTAVAKNFGIDFSSSRGNIDFNTNGFSRPGGGIEVGFVRGNFRATLTALSNDNKVKVVTAPRVTAINNLTATIQSTTSTPLILNSSLSGIGGQVGQQQNLIYITTSVGLNVTPTINGDDTITVLMQPQFQEQNVVPDIDAPAISSQVVQTIANVKDGDTIALGGLRTKSITNSRSRVPLLGDIPLIGRLFESRAQIDNDAELIIFLTARIVRRADDEFAVPGT
mgnify:CR=1 FL=1